jgi:carnitine 3-dehydrogenase
VPEQLTPSSGPSWRSADAAELDASPVLEDRTWTGVDLDEASIDRPELRAGPAAASRPEAVRTIACVGAGVIGGGWVAYFLARGFRVRAWDPAPDAESRLRTIVEAAWPALTDLGLADGASLGNLTVDAELADAVGAADYVQESAPEQLALKRRLLADIAAATAEHVVIGSSTSGFGMTEMAVDAGSGHRLVVAHPFNPPYLIPLVEVVGGERTASDVIKWTGEFFRHIGKSVITMDREVPGFIANRLQEALWREALHMVANGEATVEQIDASITEGPGLRWAFHGPMLTFHLAGGSGGMAHMLDHFGPSLLSPWTRLDAPELTPELRDAVVRGCEEEAGGRTITDLVRERDRRLVDLLRVLGKAPDG